MDNGEWAEGYYIKLGSHHLIADKTTDWDNAGEPGVIEIEGLIEVDPATVGQSTGKLDKNGVEIYGGCTLRDGSFHDDETLWEGVVFWHKDDACWYVKSQEGIKALAIYAPSQECEVIGDFHDNPELIQENPNG